VFEGGGSFALYLDGSLEKGTSGRCATYNNPPLAGRDTFKCLVVEVWGFV
jgi:hypothetical protein